NEADRSIAQPWREIGGKVDGHRVGEDTAALIANAQKLADFGMRTVCGNKILAAQHELSRVVDTFHAQPHRALAVLQSHNFVAGENTRTTVFRLIAQDGFEIGLVEKQAPAR